jgi:hypothetical protein
MLLLKFKNLLKKKKTDKGKISNAQEIATIVASLNIRQALAQSQRSQQRLTRFLALETSQQTFKSKERRK